MGDKKTWEELRDIKVGTILHDEFDEGIRFIVMRGPASLCAYIGLPISHPLSDHDYNLLPIDCHGGLTFGKAGGDVWPEGFFWYGWDYAHSGDCSFSDDRFIGTRLQSNEKKWLVEDVIKDSWSAKYDFKNMMKLAEQIADKVKASK